MKTGGERRTAYDDGSDPIGASPVLAFLFFFSPFEMGRVRVSSQKERVKFSQL